MEAQLAGHESGFDVGGTEVFQVLDELIVHPRVGVPSETENEGGYGILKAERAKESEMLGVLEILVIMGFQSFRRPCDSGAQGFS